MKMSRRPTTRVNLPNLDIPAIHLGPPPTTPRGAMTMLSSCPPCPRCRDCDKEIRDLQLLVTERENTINTIEDIRTNADARLRDLAQVSQNEIDRVRHMYETLEQTLYEREKALEAANRDRARLNRALTDLVNPQRLMQYITTGR